MGLLSMQCYTTDLPSRLLRTIIGTRDLQKQSMHACVPCVHVRVRLCLWVSGLMSVSVFYDVKQELNMPLSMDTAQQCRQETARVRM